MSTDENYWDRISEKDLQDGYYWYRDSTGVEPEIVRSFMKRPDPQFFDENVEKERHLEFLFNYAESEEFTVEEILRRFPNAQIAVERIVPPNN